MKHALQFVSATVHELSEMSFDEKVTGKSKWLLHFCSSDEGGKECTRTWSGLIHKWD